MESCHNFYIRSSLVTPDIKHVYFEGELIGFITPDREEGGFLAEPAGARYSARFGNIETACIELIFHVYGQTRQIPRC